MAMALLSTLGAQLGNLVICAKVLACTLQLFNVLSAPSPSNRDSQSAQAAPPGPGCGSGLPVPVNHGSVRERLLRVRRPGGLPALAMQAGPPDVSDACGDALTRQRKIASDLFPLSFF